MSAVTTAPAARSLGPAPHWRLLARAVSALMLAAGVGGLAGCSSGGSTGEPSPTLTITKPSAPVDAGPLADFLSVDEQRPLATTPAKNASSYSGGTFTILSLVTTEESTLLVWSANHPRTLAAGSDFDVTAIGNFPVLSTKEKDYQVLTYPLASGKTACVCTDMRAMRAEAHEQGALYPPLPKGTTSVVLSSPWFNDVTVRVTHK